MTRPIRIKRRVAAMPVGRPALPDLLTVAEVAERLRSTPQHIHNLISRDELGSVKVGRKRLVLASELLAFIERNTERAAS